jgi:hypothetical protein
MYIKKSDPWQMQEQACGMKFIWQPLYIPTASHNYCYAELPLYIPTAPHNYCYAELPLYIPTAPCNYCYTELPLHISKPTQMSLWRSKQSHWQSRNLTQYQKCNYHVHKNPPLGPTRCTQMQSTSSNPIIIWVLFNTV